MLVPYESLSDDAKVWVYPASRKFYTSEIQNVAAAIESFVKNWKKNDESFSASYQFLHQRFIVLVADDSESPLKREELDAAVGFILDLQNQYEMELLDKMNVCFKQGEYVQYKELKEFKKLLKNRAVTGKSIIFDNLVSNNYDFKNHWEIPIEESWYNRFL